MRHRGQQPPFDPQRKLRTPEHVDHDLSYNFLERKVLLRGHWLDSPRNDYGIGAIMFHHNQRGEVENGEVRFQLKAQRGLRKPNAGKWIARRVDIRDLRYWYFDMYPVILILYDAERHRALWLHLQEYVDQHPGLLDSKNTGTVTVRVPTRKTLDLRAVDRFRQLSLEAVAESRNRHQGG